MKPSTNVHKWSSPHLWVLHFDCRIAIAFPKKALHADDSHASKQGAIDLPAGLGTVPCHPCQSFQRPEDVDRPLVPADPRYLGEKTATKSRNPARASKKWYPQRRKWAYYKWYQIPSFSTVSWKMSPFKPISFQNVSFSSLNHDCWRKCAHQTHRIHQTHSILPRHRITSIQKTPYTSNLSKRAMLLTWLDIEELWNGCRRIQRSTRITYIRRDQKLFTLQFGADPSTRRTMSSKDLVVKPVAHHLLQTKITCEEVSKTAFAFGCPSSSRIRMFTHH